MCIRDSLNIVHILEWRLLSSWQCFYISNQIWNILKWGVGPVSRVCVYVCMYVCMYVQDGYLRNRLTECNKIWHQDRVQVPLSGATFRFQFWTFLQKLLAKKGQIWAFFGKIGDNVLQTVAHYLWHVQQWDLVIYKDNEPIMMHAFFIFALFACVSHGGASQMGQNRFFAKKKKIFFWLNISFI